MSGLTRMRTETSRLIREAAGQPDLRAGWDRRLECSSGIIGKGETWEEAFALHGSRWVATLGAWIVGKEPWIEHELGESPSFCDDAFECAHLGTADDMARRSSSR